MIAFNKVLGIGVCVVLLSIAGCSDGVDGEPSAGEDIGISDTVTTTSRRSRGGGCPAVPPGQTLIRATVMIEAPDFRQHGHEHVRARIVSTSSVGSPKVVTTPEVELAMVIARGGVGLPRELPLVAGETIDVQGVYVPKEQAYGTNHQWAVIHFTHAPCGFATIDGTTYD